MEDEYKVTVNGTPRWSCSTTENAFNRANGYKDNHKVVTVSQNGKVLHKWVDGVKIK